MNKWILCIALSLSAATVLAYSSLEALLAESNRKQVEDLRAYMAANPQAGDLAEARERLIYALVSIDDHNGALTILEGMYAELPEDKSALDLSYAFGEIVAPMIQLFRMEGRKADALGFVENVREDFKSHAMADTINEALDEFADGFNAPSVGETMELSFTALDGRDVNLGDLKGRVVLVDFWATWCVPCLKTMPALKEIYASYHDRGFEIIGVSLDEDREKLESYLAKEGIMWPQHYDGNGWENEYARQYGIEAIPATFLIGKDGEIVGANLSETALKSKLASLLPDDATDSEP